jgi:hypothetical protein
MATAAEMSLLQVVLAVQACCHPSMDQVFITAAVVVGRLALICHAI